MEIRRQVQRLGRRVHQHGLRRKRLRRLGRGVRPHRQRQGLAGLRVEGVAGRHDDNGLAHCHGAEGQLAAALRHLGDEHGVVVRHRRERERVAVGVVEIRRQVQRLARLAHQQGLRRKRLRRLGRGYRPHRHRHGLAGLLAVGVAGRHDDNGLAGRHAAEGQPVAVPRQVGDDDAGVVRHRRVGERVAVGVLDIRRQVQRLARLARPHGLQRKRLRRLGGGVRP